MLRTLKIGIVILVAAYLAVVAGMYFGQRRMLYLPNPTRIQPASVGLPSMRERIIETPDGEKLVTWSAPAKPGQPTLLFFHGQGGGIADLNELLAKYLARGRGVAIMAYRGFSGSTGAPSEKANVADAKLAHAMLLHDGVKPADILLYGESLGTGVALQVAVDHPVGGVILDSPYTSVADRAFELYPFIPVHLLIKDAYESSRHVRNVRAPLFIVHGEADIVVPVEMGRKLFALANEPKEIVTLPRAGHNNHDLYGSFEAINGWIDRLRRRGPQ